MDPDTKINKRLDFELIRKDLFENGFSGPHKLFDSDEILPIQETVYSRIKKYITNDDSKLSLLEKLNLPLEGDIPRKFIFDLRAEMTSVVTEFSHSSVVKNIFVDLFDSKDVVPCGSFHDFRGNFPEFTLHATGWHQDAETFFTHGHKEWKHSFYAMWVSLNDANQGNSVEFIGGSHQAKHLYSQNYSDSSRDISDISKKLSKLSATKIECHAGDVFFIDPLVFHRSVINKNNYARFSIDVRYYDPSSVQSYSSIDKGLYVIKTKQFLKDSYFYRNVSNWSFLRKFLGMPPR